MLDRDRLRSLYDGLRDEELKRIWQTELVADARSVLENEMKARGLAVPTTEPRIQAPLRSRFSLRNPYLPPGALVADLHAEAVITVRGLVRLFQWLVIATTTLGVLLFAWPFVGLPISETMLNIRFAEIGGIWGKASYLINYAAGAAGFLAGIGLYFFRWWARWLFVVSYILGAVSTQLGGMLIWFPVEATFITIATLLDGAVLALAFLPPLSRFFESTTG